MSDSKAGEVYVYGRLRDVSRVWLRHGLVVREGSTGFYDDGELTHKILLG